MTDIPLPGDVSPGFIAEAGRCWRMVYDHNLQATHCDDAPRWTGRWRSPKGDRWWLHPMHWRNLSELVRAGRPGGEHVTTQAR